MEKLYENIRKIRILKGLSQQNMADELNLSQRHYSRIERGLIDVTYSNLCKIAELLGTSVAQLIGIEEMNVFNNFNQPQKDGHFIAYNATDVDNITNLYERLLKEKDQVIETYKCLLNKMNN